MAEFAEDRHVIDGAARALREAETWQGAAHQVPVLYADETALLVEVGDGEPVGAPAVAVGGQSAPAHHPLVQSPFLEEEPPCRLREPGVLKKRS